MWYITLSFNALKLVNEGKTRKLRPMISIMVTYVQKAFKHNQKVLSNVKPGT